MLSKKLLSASQSGGSGGGGGGGGSSGISFVGFANGDETGSSPGLSPYVSFGSSAISGVQNGDKLFVFVSDDFSLGSASVQGWSYQYFTTNISGSSTRFCLTKTVSVFSNGTSLSVSATRSGSSSTFVCPSSVMVAFRNVSSFTVSGPSSDRDDPLYGGPYSSGDASLIAHHYQDDNSRASSSPYALSGYTNCGNSFRYISSSTSSGTSAWYDLSPSTNQDVSDIYGVGGDLGACTIRLTP